MNSQLIIAPLVGGIIGLVTNGIAIKMLFRPYNPIYIGKIKLPFTPGVIPKEKKRIAQSVGNLISEQLLNEEIFGKTLLSDNMKEIIYSKLDGLFQEYSNSNMTIAECIQQYDQDNKFDSVVDEISYKITQKVKEAAVEADLGTIIVEYAVNEVITKLNPMILALAKGAIENAKTPLIEKLNGVIEEKSGPMIEDFLTDQKNEIFDKKLSDIMEEYEDKLPELKNKIWNLYEYIINNKLGDILETVNIAGIVRNKIEELDLPELEKMLLDLMKKELNALIMLGGVLGIIMGFLNIIIGYFI